MENPAKEFSGKSGKRDGKAVPEARPSNDMDRIESDARRRGRLSPPGLDDEMEFERRNPGSGGEGP